MLNVRVDDLGEGYWIDNGDRVLLVDEKIVEADGLLINDNFFMGRSDPIHTTYNVKVGEYHPIDKIPKTNGTVIYSATIEQVLLCKNGNWYHGNNPQPEVNELLNYKIVELGTD